MNMQRRTQWAAALLCVLISAELSAHAVLVKAVPGQDAVLDKSPPTVSVWFNEALEAAFSSLAVEDSRGQVVAQGALASLPDNGLSLRLPAPLAAGSYRLHYRVLSVDGHIVEGSSPFVIGEPGAR
jgi:methionine-rich copper-binding protein CopC